MWTIARIVMIVESYIFGVWMERSSEMVPLNNPLVENMWLDAALTVGSGWEQLRDGWRTWAEVNLSKCPMWEKMRAWVEARNAIVHGLGKLTLRQVRKRPATVATLSKVGIGLRGDLLDLDLTHAEDCAMAAAYVITWLDLQTISA